MNHIAMLTSTGDPRIDAILQGVVGIFETAFPDRVRGYYVTGSYADSSAILSSDIDGFILFKEDFVSDEEREKARQLLQNCALIMSPEFDMLPVGERRFRHYGHVNLKFSSLLVYGEDIRDRIPMPPIKLYARLLMHETCRFLSRVRSNPPYLSYPLNYPDPNAEYYGYDRGERDRSAQPDTKELMNCVGKVALAIVTLQAGVYVKSKSDCLVQYKLHINDEWTALIDDIYSKVRNAWSYGLPEDEVGQKTLKEICERTLAFENHYLVLYKNFLISELRDEEDTGLWLDLADATDPDPFGIASAEALQQKIAAGTLQSRTENGEHQVLIEQLFKIVAARMLGKVLYADDKAVIGALKSLEDSEDEYLRQAVEGTLKCYQGSESIQPSGPRRS